MRFKYFFGLLLLCCSCQKIEQKLPEPIVLKPEYTGKDTIFTIPSCNSYHVLKLNGSSYAQVLSSDITTTTTAQYTQYYYSDPGTGYIEIFVKKQKIAPKIYKVIPYDPSFVFKNYHEAMIRVYLNFNGGFYNSTDGTLNFNSLLNMGFCNLDFDRVSSGSTYKISFTYY